MDRCCKSKSCFIECRHCKTMCCSRHIQQELHKCKKLETKDVIVLPTNVYTKSNMLTVN